MANLYGYLIINSHNGKDQNLNLNKKLINKRLLKHYNDVKKLVNVCD